MSSTQLKVPIAELVAQFEDTHKGDQIPGVALCKLLTAVDRSNLHAEDINPEDLAALNDAAFKSTKRIFTGNLNNLGCTLQEAAWRKLSRKPNVWGGVFDMAARDVVVELDVVANAEHENTYFKAVALMDVVRRPHSFLHYMPEPQAQKIADALLVTMDGFSESQKRSVFMVVGMTPGWEDLKCLQNDGINLLPSNNGSTSDDIAVTQIAGAVTQQPAAGLDN